MQKVAVFFGGRSCEREISILTGVFVLNLLDKERFSPLPIYLHTDGRAYTHPSMIDLNFFKKQLPKMQPIFFDGHTVYALNAKKGRIKTVGGVDAAINCCHGGLGEGGGVSALCQYHAIPLASPDMTSSAIFLDKSVTKLFLRALNIPTVDFVKVCEGDYQRRGAFLLKTVERKLGYPVVVKPARLGSSIGISLARNEEELKEALVTAFALDGRVLVEKYLKDKRDVNCAAFMRDGEIFVSEVELAFGQGIYSFEEKYEKRGKEGGRYAFTGELREKIRAYTRTVYKRMSLNGVARMDFLVSGGKVYLCEVNTVPGSLAYYLFCERLSDAKGFFSELIDEAMEKAGAEKKLLVKTGILQRAKLSSK